MPSIEMAKKHELPTIIRLCMQRAKEFDFSCGMPEPDLDDLSETILNNWLVSPCFVVKKEGEIVGLSSTNLDFFGWNKKKPYLGMFMTYVLPEHRNFSTIKKLYKSVQDYASLHGLLLCDSYIAIDRVDGRRRLMQSLGFKESGFLLTFKGEEHE